MIKLWNYIKNKPFTRAGKIRLFLTINTAVWALLGFLLWLLVRNITLQTYDWAVCFTGYSGLCIGFGGGIRLLWKEY